MTVNWIALSAAFATTVLLTRVSYSLGYKNRGIEDRKQLDDVRGAVQRLSDTAKEALAHGVVKKESDAFKTFEWELGDPCADSSLKSLKGFVQDLVKEDLVPSCFGSVDAQLVKETLRNTIDRVKKDLRERRLKS